MTEIKLSFRAQSLDNIGDDTIIGDGELLDPSQEIERQQVVSRIYSVVSDKTQILSDSNITIYCKKSKFVIEAIPDKLDIRKRKAPIVIYGELPKEWSQSWSSSIRFRIKNFSEGINRPLNEKTLDAIEEGLRTTWLKKNQPSNLLLHKAAIAALWLLMGCLLQFRYMYYF
jgi:hypothetical protein